ncbi:lytic transglycosylase domain-containing protein [Zhouia spongiae]|uniref:Lytic transglycosylase domain-containing protein n=1 Tax=Zhouia spongiae TaxID=2202721 RepID=A0ABY3YIH0_9FLAO|nr:lytic transglycosylase domain-containing protein [Zhouia spongiae]UNY97662.1 lytic transglycosylase domain-containing protein [Zhouia spongiae]
MKYAKFFLMSVGAVVLASMFINAAQTEQEVGQVTEPDKQAAIDEGKTKDYNVYAIDLPEKIDFAGEEVPLSDPDVWERLDRELLVNTYWQSNGLLLIKRANKYFPVIEPILKEHGVPDDFKYLAVIESGLQNVVSPARATGFWQIMKGTGKDYGLEVNENVDERYHVKKSTEVACEYIKDAKEKLGSWTLAAAAYNAGMAGVTKQLRRQKVSGYYDLLLGEETKRYLFRILAIKEILSDPDAYGFNFEEDHLYRHIPTYEVEVDTPVTDFADFAKKFDINYKILKIHNPWLRDSFLNNASKKKYQIEIPEKGYYPETK